MVVVLSQACVVWCGLRLRGTLAARSRPHAGHSRSPPRGEAPATRRGDGTNGALLGAGLVGELNVVQCPVDDAKGAPSVFDSTEAEGDRRAPVTAMTEINQVPEAMQWCCGTGSR
jgi:hypothetical protein